MTTQALSRAIKDKKPSIIKERGKPRYVVLGWGAYKALEEMKEDLEDVVRLNEALSDPKNKKRIKFSGRL